MIEQSTNTKPCFSARWQNNNAYAAKMFLRCGFFFYKHGNATLTDKRHFKMEIERWTGKWYIKKQACNEMRGGKTPSFANQINLVCPENRKHAFSMLLVWSVLFFNIFEYKKGTTSQLLISKRGTISSLNS